MSGLAWFCLPFLEWGAQVWAPETGWGGCQQLGQALGKEGLKSLP
jgi:hypothetical protein